MVHALAGTGARILVLERGEVVPSEDDNWSPAAVWKDLRYRTTERWTRRSAASRSSPTPTTASAGTRSSGAACSIGCAARTSARSSTPMACRRPGRSTTRRWRRTTTAPSSCTRCAARPARTRPNRREVPSRTPRCRMPPACRPSSDDLRRQGLHPVAAPAGAAQSGGDGGCVLCNTCNSFPCKLRREERRRRVLCPAGAAASQRHALDRRAGPAA